MKLLLFTLGICVGIVGFANLAEAQNYPWCAYYSGKFGGTNCGFTKSSPTIQFGRAARSGSFVSIRFSGIACSDASALFATAR
jgi:hypothetical protein